MIMSLNLFSSDAAGATMLPPCEGSSVCYHCCLNGHLNAHVCEFIILLAAQVFSRVHDVICFTPVMRFGNSLDMALLDYQHDLACLFSSEARGAVGLKPGEHFNYNHSITTLCFKVREVARRKGSGAEHMPTITPSAPFDSLLFHTLLMSDSLLLRE